ncbi:MAG: hypothetical protein ACLPY1_07680 [Terracidiphilus sp.]
MANFPNPEFPISSADCADIEAIFIELMRDLNAATQAGALNSTLPFNDPPASAQDHRSM